MRIKRNHWRYLTLTAIIVLLAAALVVGADDEDKVYLPVISQSDGPLVEIRGLWVTRFDWTNYNSADKSKIDEIVDNSANAGFNALFFQVRGEGDAYYKPGPEPWARRLTGTLGEDPGWDPLGYLIEIAHKRGLQVHAYINVYPLWTGCDAPPDDTNPRHFYHSLVEEHGMTDGKPNGLMWNTEGDVLCLPYQRVTPASEYFNSHIVAVAKYLDQQYDIDGLHLDHIRYGGVDASCDPVSEARFGGDCFGVAGYEDFQRQQVNGTVRKVYEEVVSPEADLWLTAAVWPVYRDVWGWGASSGFDSYYQDPKAWMADEYIDGVAPMIYSGSPNCDQGYFWTLDRWQLLVEDYLDGSHGRLIIPGIGTSFCTDNDFGEIEARIDMARSLGAGGHAIFSYGSLLNKGYFDDLASGPYRVPAVLPELLWR